MTNDQLGDRVREALRTCGYGQLRNLLVNCDNGCVILDGSVPTKSLMQAAESVVRAVPGVDAVINELTLNGVKVPVSR